MKSIFHPANSRGKADHGWLNSFHSFSFASYYNPDRMNFGALRVLNDDRIAPGTGFGKHPHENMEIISIPLEGKLKHEDSMGSKGVIENGEVQVMSAGTGIVHSEMNASQTEECAFLQIWIITNAKNAEPRYGQGNINQAQNQWSEIVGPKENHRHLWIHQDAWIHLSTFDKGQTPAYEIKKPGNGVYFFLLEGEITIGNDHLKKRDALGVWDTDCVDLTIHESSRILTIEVQMQW